MKKQLMILIALAATGIMNAANKDLAGQIASLQKTINEKILPEIQELSEKTSQFADQIAKLQESKKGLNSETPKKTTTKEVPVLQEEPEEEIIYVD